MSEMNVLDYTGHTKHIWNKDDDNEVEAAEELFTSLTAKGYAAFEVKKDGTEGKRITHFNPDAEKMILTRPLAGG